MSYHSKWDCCCYCFSTKMGVQIISVGIAIGLLEEYAAMNFIRCAIKIALLVPFVMMFVNDCAFHRQLCLYLFCLCVPLIFIVNTVAYQNILVDNVMFAEEFCGFSKWWVATFGGSKAENEAQEECNEADEEDQADCEANLDQCPILPGGILKVLFVITPLVCLINIHFAFVLYTHWKNARLPESQGGCADTDGPEPDEFDD